MYRAPYSKEWKTVSWEWALDQIANRIKKTRDAGFIHKNDAGDVVNRVTNMASMGSAAMDEAGNIAIGYSASDASSTYPSVWYAGRLSGDPLGTLPQGERILGAARKLDFQIGMG